jgi:hypothetical protein
VSPAPACGCRIFGQAKLKRCRESVEQVQALTRPGVRSWWSFRCCSGVVSKSRSGLAQARGGRGKPVELRARGGVTGSSCSRSRLRLRRVRDRWVAHAWADAGHQSSARAEIESSDRSERWRHTVCVPKIRSRPTQVIRAGKSDAALVARAASCSGSLIAGDQCCEIVGRFARSRCPVLVPWRACRPRRAAADRRQTQDGSIVQLGAARWLGYAGALAYLCRVLADIG